MKLYALSGSTSLASHIALELARQAYPEELQELEVVVLDRRENRGARYRAINPFGTVPALDTGAGEILTESLAVLLHIADRFPQAELAPPVGSPERDRMHMLLSVMVTTAHSAFQLYRRTERFVNGEAGQASARELAQLRLNEVLTYLDAQLREEGVLIGPRITVADIMLFVVARWGMSLPHSTQCYPSLWRFTKRLAEVPAVVRAMEVEGISMDVPSHGLG